ncbi:hypothetical protein CHARACLAT_020213 [Characodon lateralis]|uniref:Uncharacterized protein n=1 Tax=Characodon lateralis TaxID=208331 RepID=A0ABU7EE67_9TELE|nr:hypothetical protein [Characodon lateralis]
MPWGLQPFFHISKIYTRKMEGVSLTTFLEKVDTRQPFLLCICEQKKNIQRFFIVVDQKAIACDAATSEAAFHRLFKAHLSSASHMMNLFPVFTPSFKPQSITLKLRTPKKAHEQQEVVKETHSQGELLSDEASTSASVLQVPTIITQDSFVGMCGSFVAQLQACGHSESACSNNNLFYRGSCQ